MNSRVLLAFGANLGNPLETFQYVGDLLTESKHFENVRSSSPVATKPIGGPAGQPAFQNAAISLETELTADDVIEQLLEFEKKLGRKRRERWDARTVDLDLMLFDQQVIQMSQCVVPHPRMTFRRFMLEPAVEVAGNWVHPLCGMTLQDLLLQIQSASETILACEKISKALRVSIAAANYRLEESSYDELIELSREDNYSKRPRLILINSESRLIQRHSVPGPYLDVAGMPAQRLDVEIAAALAAMAPLS